MKKLFVMLLALTVLGMPAFAQKTVKHIKPMPKVNGEYIEILDRGLSEKVALIMSDTREEIPQKAVAVLNSLQSFREITEKRKEFNGSYSLQDMMDLMDNYLALYKKSEQAALTLNEEINKPIKAGWGQTVTIPQLIRDNIQHVFAGSSTADDLETFEFLLGKTPEKPASKK